MKRYGTIVIGLLIVVGMVTAVFAGIRKATPGVQVRFNKRDFPEHGVHLVTPVDLSFDQTVSEYFKNKSPETFKPFSVFIQNSGDKMIAAYALTWEFAKKDGKLMSNTVGYSEPGILMGDEMPKDLIHTTAITPNSVRCFSWGSQIQQTEDPEKNSSEVRARLTSELSQATDVTVSLEGVVFDDGTYVGPSTMFFEQMQAIINAKVDLLREIELASKENKVDQVLELISAESMAPDVAMASEFSIEAYYRHFRKLYASEMTNMTRAHGKEAMVQHLVRSSRRAHPVLRKK